MADLYGSDLYALNKTLGEVCINTKDKYTKRLSDYEDYYYEKRGELEIASYDRSRNQQISWNV